MEIAFMAGFLVVLILIIKPTFQSIYKTIRASGWESTQGQYLVNFENDLGLAVSRKNRGYKYSVNGKEYFGQRVGFGLYTEKEFKRGKFNIHNTLLAFIVLRSLYKNNINPTIYYNPENPEESSLIVGMSSYHWYRLLLSLVLVSVVILMSHDLVVAILTKVST